MKKYYFLILLFFIVFSCKYPTIIKQLDKNYKIINWEGGNFYYITYVWKGGKFEDAIDIIKEFVAITDKRNLNEIAIGRFPTGKEWQLGILTKESFDITEIKGSKINSINIPSGEYASLLGKGYPENIFVFWNKFKKWLEKDNYNLESPVFEIYQKAFDTNIDVKERIGEIRYKIKKNN